MRAAVGNNTERLGDYELVYELKSGGMGKIFLARKRGAGGFEKLAAIKTMLRELSGREDMRTMFLDEARLLARLDHPAVAQVHDFGEQDNTLYLTMEYVAGVRFTDLRNESVDPGVVMRLVAQVCRALHAAHSLCDLDGSPLDVVHRDVSPDNLMLSFDGHVKVLDFGIALMRGRNSPATEYGTIKGKPPYLSPEQVKGERVNHLSDIWSAGVVLWDVLVDSNKKGPTGRATGVITAVAALEEDLPKSQEKPATSKKGTDDVATLVATGESFREFSKSGEPARDSEFLGGRVRYAAVLLLATGAVVAGVLLFATANGPSRNGPSKNAGGHADASVAVSVVLEGSAPPDARLVAALVADASLPDAALVVAT